MGQNAGNKGGLCINPWSVMLSLLTICKNGAMQSVLRSGAVRQIPWPSALRGQRNRGPSSEALFGEEILLLDWVHCGNGAVGLPCRWGLLESRLFHCKNRIIDCIPGISIDYSYTFTEISDLLLRFGFKTVSYVFIGFDSDILSFPLRSYATGSINSFLLKRYYVSKGHSVLMPEGEWTVAFWYVAWVWR